MVQEPANQAVRSRAAWQAECWLIFSREVLTIIFLISPDEFRPHGRDIPETTLVAGAGANEPCRH